VEKHVLVANIGRILFHALDTGWLRLVVSTLWRPVTKPQLIVNRFPLIFGHDFGGGIGFMIVAVEQVVAHNRHVFLFRPEVFFLVFHRGFASF